MARPRKVVFAASSPPPVEFYKETEATLPNGKTITAGEIVKVSGEYGTSFIFDSLTTNTITGVQWIDCREIFRGKVGVYRSFYANRIKKIPIRRKRVKRNTAS